MAYPPFMLARLILDPRSSHRGRFGWNIVTSTEDAAAQNMGMTELAPRALRYDMADEYVDLVEKLSGAGSPTPWSGTWRPALPLMPPRCTKIDFEGRWYRSLRTLNTVRCPQDDPLHPGRRISARPPLRRRPRRFDHRGDHRHRRHEGLS